MSEQNGQPVKKSDDELVVIARIQRMLAKQTPEARNRIMNYVSERARQDYYNNVKTGLVGLHPSAAPAAGNAEGLSQ